MWEEEGNRAGGERKDWGGGVREEKGGKKKEWRSEKREEDECRNFKIEGRVEG